MKTNILALFILFITTSNSAMGVSYLETFEQDGITYMINNNINTVSVKRVSSDKEGEIIIPPTVFYAYKDRPVTEIGYQAFMSCTKITSVIIPESVTRIGEDSFKNCSGLHSILLPQGVSSLFGTFEGCSSLKNIELPGNLTDIGEYTFKDCSQLSTVIIPETVKKIGIAAFAGCTSLTYISIPDSLKSLEYNTFYNCGTIDTLVIGANLRTINQSAFGEDDTKINTLIIKNGSKVIHGDASKDMIDGVVYIPNNLVINLKNILIPESVLNIENSFVECSSLKQVHVFWRNPARTNLSSSCFGTISSSAILYVPAGTKERYAEHKVWGRFSQIIESGPISTGDISARYGSRVDLPIYLKNDEVIEGLQFKLTLPEGVSVAEDEEGLITSTTDRTNGMTVMGRKDPDADNSYLFVLLSLEGNTITGNEGVFMNVKLNIDSDVDLGDYEIKIEDVYMTTASYETLHPAEATSDLIMTDIVMGDVNNDGVINVTDAIGVVNYILKNVPSVFVEEAADVNNDGVINITDAIGIVNMILGKETPHYMIRDYSTEPQ